MLRPALRLATVVALFALGGCGWFGGGKKADLNTAEGLFKEAKEQLNSGDFNKAIKSFESLESKFPYGVHAQQAMLDLAWANYRTNEFATAVSHAERFIKLHPTHANVDYAWYIKGLALFGEDFGIFRFLADQDISERDPKARRESFLAFREIVEKFPNGKYGNDARLRMRYLLNSLADYEVHVAQYYFNRKAYIAAVNRAQLAIVNYPESTANEGALFLLAQAHEALGRKDLAADTMRILEKNYPKSKHLAAAKPWWRLW